MSGNSLNLEYIELNCPEFSVSELHNLYDANLLEITHTLSVTTWFQTTNYKQQNLHKDKIRKPLLAALFPLQGLVNNRPQFQLKAVKTINISDIDCMSQILDWSSWVIYGELSCTFKIAVWSHDLTNRRILHFIYFYQLIVINQSCHYPVS